MERDPLIAQESEIQAHQHGSAGVDGDGGKSVLSSKANSISGDENSPLLGAGERDGGADIDDFAGLPWHRKPSIFWLLPPFCLFTIAFGGVAVPRLNIILALICREFFAEKQYLPGGMTPVMPILIGAPNEQCRNPEVAALVSKFTLYMGLIGGIIGAFTSPRIGSLSDRYGRRAFMACSSFGLLASEITTILAAKFPETFSVNILLLGSAVDGICGSFLLGMALSYSYGADCTSPAKRAMAFGYFQGCLFLGIAVGPAMGGWLIEATGNVLSIFYFALGAHVFFILYLFCILPESLSDRRKKIAQEKHAQEIQIYGGTLKSWVHTMNPVNLVRPLSVLFPTGPGSSPRLRLNLMLLAATDTILFGVGIGGMTVIILFAELKFGWGNYESSIYLSIVNVARVTMLFVILPVVVHYVRRNHHPSHHQKGADKLDILLIRFSIIIEAAGYLFYAVAATSNAFTAAGVCTALGGIGSPTLQSSLTKHVPDEKTGQLLGATALLHSLARVVAPTVFNLVYAYTVATFPQTVFVCLGSTFAFAFACSWFLKEGVYWGDGKGGANGDEEEVDTN
ncbi:uncharacterized protein H6S33_006451 [Morchella sextelata]|uniref:uncharacterized protein n=1 Tax=Morchella sextelata TaxID=1174677 RepID=UPI001D0565F0|nr:uncharacterized protein H6S33_006451 [Morchella sextelata]KAH0604783.1 hypothetical protein H6S33_006451 [Morchella sextelata]